MPSLLEDLQKLAVNLPVSHQPANPGALVAALVEVLEDPSVRALASESAEVVAKYVADKYPPAPPPTAIPTSGEHVAAMIDQLQRQIDQLKNPPPPPSAEAVVAAPVQPTVVTQTPPPNAAAVPSEAAPPVQLPSVQIPDEQIHETPEPAGSPEQPSQAELIQQLQQSQLALAQARAAVVESKPVEPQAPSE